ncbi:hypothetical protein OG985_42085 [Streptomyces sp. NBC_00289]|uniref:hypothetical protein n=1 Tax=Streptomyces sp. NBC_00289 TaxID=2975703 RepID=UPI00325680B3
MSHRKRAIGWIAGSALAAAVMGLTGCSDSTDSTADKESAASSSPAADTDKSEEGKPEDASASSRASAAGQSTAEGAVAAWVTAVVKGEVKDACLLMGEAAKGSSPARAGSEATCDGDAPQGKQMEKNIGQFREAFTPEPPTDDPKVDVAKVPATGGKAVVPADKITVDGQTLDKIILSHSTGVKSGQLDVKVHSTKIDEAWYVTDLDLDIG